MNLKENKQFKKLNNSRMNIEIRISKSIRLNSLLFTVFLLAVFLSCDQL